MGTKKSPIINKSTDDEEEFKVCASCPYMDKCQEDEECDTFRNRKPKTKTPTKDR